MGPLIAFALACGAFCALPRSNPLFLIRVAAGGNWEAVLVAICALFDAGVRISSDTDSARRKPATTQTTPRPRPLRTGESRF